MSAFNSENVMRFHQKFFKQNEDSENAEHKSFIFEVKIGENKLEGIQNIITEIKKNLASTSDPNDPQVIQLFETLDYFRDRLMQPDDNDKTNETNAENLPTVHTEDEKVEDENQKREKIIARANAKQQSNDDSKKSNKPKSIIIRTDYSRQFLLEIMFYLKYTSISLVSLMDEDKIFLTFEDSQDCKNFKKKMETVYPGFKIFIEEDQNVEIIIDDVGDMLTEDAEKQIVKMTGEVPYNIIVLAKGLKEHWVIYAEISSLAYLKIQAYDEFAIKIGGGSYQYYLFSEEEMYW